jgi:hypothetical protein
MNQLLHSSLNQVIHFLYYFRVFISFYILTAFHSHHFNLEKQQKYQPCYIISYVTL